MPDIIVKSSPKGGKGIFAGRDFTIGELVVPWKEDYLTKDQVDALPESEKHFVDPLEDGRYILHGEPERYINHSCDPNTAVGEGGDRAIRAIVEGEEITTDYAAGGTEQLVHFKCDCGSDNCREYI